MGEFQANVNHAYEEFHNAAGVIRTLKGLGNPLFPEASQLNPYAALFMMFSNSRYVHEHNNARRGEL